MVHVYCISGIGADERVFSKLDLPGCEIHPIKWIMPFRNESMKNYAVRLAAQIKHAEPVLIGVSFGGMMAVELSKLFPFKKVILISSARKADELPLWMKVCGALKLNKIFPPPRKNKFFIPVENYFLGPQTPEEEAIIDAFRQSVSRRFLNWSIDKILNWGNMTVPANIVLILGNKDKFFPFRKAKPDHVIAGGTHFMVYNKAGEINPLLQQLISPH